MRCEHSNIFQLAAEAMNSMTMAEMAEEPTAGALLEVEVRVQVRGVREGGEGLSECVESRKL